MTLGRKIYSIVLCSNYRIYLFITDSLCTDTTSGTDYLQSNEGTTSEVSTGKDTEWNGYGVQLRNLSGGILENPDKITRLRA
jgi:hypothetical protein